MNYYFAPMEGVATYILRRSFIRYYGGADKYFSPFLSNPVLSSKEKNEILPNNNEDAVLVPQILANNSGYFLDIAAVLKDYGYSEVNLNLGCPSGTVCSKKRGAGFLSEPEKLKFFLDDIFSRSDMKISIKTRLGMEDMSEWRPLLQIFSGFPFHELIIHPRLRREYYSGHAHAEAFKEALSFFGADERRLVYNGDICSVKDQASLLSEIPEIKTIMAGRGALMDPELFLRLRENKTEGAAKERNPLRDDKTALERFISFHDEIFEAYNGIMYGEKPVLFKMKELWNWFCVYASLDKDELKKIRKASSLADYELRVKQILKS